MSSSSKSVTSKSEVSINWFLNVELDVGIFGKPCDITNRTFSLIVATGIRCECDAPIMLTVSDTIHRRKRNEFLKNEHVMVELTKSDS